MSNLATQPAVDRLPQSAWAIAWLFLVGQVVLLVTRGVNPADWPMVVVSMLLTAVIVRWLASGVLRARTVRLAIVWILLSLATGLSLVGLLIDPAATTAVDLVDFAFTVAELVALGAFCRTNWFKNRRRSPNVSRSALAPLLLVVVATGLLGGLTAPFGGDAARMQIDIQL
ncbi:hypothetical protein ASG90_00895 [Nocardioides sp. Soil797]|nr:hypothetical protein ASG90_00895 [Nocardioides sp. Soil797]